MDLFGDLFGKRIKKQLADTQSELAELKQKYDSLSNEYKSLQEKFKSINSSIEDTKVKEVIELEELIRNYKSEIKDLEEERNTQSSTLEVLYKQKKRLLNDLVYYNNYVGFQEYGLYVPKYDFVDSDRYKEELSKIRKRQRESIKYESAFYYDKNFTFNHSYELGAKMLKSNGKLMIRAFNTECEAAINKVTYSNFSSIEKRIIRAFNAINKSSAFEVCYITEYYLNLKLDELKLAFEYQLKKEEEKEILRAEREKKREEKALQREIKKKKKTIDKEIQHLNNVIKELQAKLTKASDDEKDSLNREIEEMKNNVNKYQDNKTELDYRIENVGAGYVYIISNIGAFGENIFKIGVTRRLNPYERITELSSASVPFKFDVHAMIFSYQAYELENELHKYFDRKRVNKVNSRKEFFNITIDEIKDALEKHKDLTFEFKESPEASEYRETKKLENALKVNSEY